MSNKQDAIVARNSPEDRAKIEKRRGIVRDDEGKIVRSKEWLEARIALLKEKRKDFENRVSNIDVEISLRKKEIKDLE